MVLSPDITIKKDNKIRMTFKIKTNDGAPEKEVTFEFNVLYDTPSGVAYEMVKELQLSSSYIDVISKQIQSAIEKAWSPDRK